VRSIKTGLRAFLDAQTASGGAPVWVGKADQNTSIPFIVLQRVRTEDYATMDAPGDDSLRSETFRITTYAHTDQSAHVIADDMAELLDGYAGAMGTDRKVEDAWIEDESGDYEPPEYVDGLALADILVTIQHSPAA
jgi:hypothetical protein